MWQSRCCLYFQLLIYGDNKITELASNVSPAGGDAQFSVNDIKLCTKYGI